MKHDESSDAELGLRLEKRIEEYQLSLHQKRSADVRRGMAFRAEKGRHVSRIPIGYRQVWKGGDTTIEADPIQAPLVHQAFHMAATGTYSVRRLHASLAEMGLRHSDGRVPSVSGLHRMLKNPFYLGLVELDGALFSGMHPALVSLDTFVKQKSIRLDKF